MRNLEANRDAIEPRVGVAALLHRVPGVPAGAHRTAADGLGLVHGGEQEERGEQGQLPELRDEGRLGLHARSPFIEEGCAEEGRGDKATVRGLFFSAFVYLVLWEGHR